MLHSLKHLNFAHAPKTVNSVAHDSALLADSYALPSAPPWPGESVSPGVVLLPPAPPAQDELRSVMHRLLTDHEQNSLRADDLHALLAQAQRKKELGTDPALAYALVEISEWVAAGECQQLAKYAHGFERLVRKKATQQEIVKDLHKLAVALGDTRLSTLESLAKCYDLQAPAGRAKVRALVELSLRTASDDSESERIDAHLFAAQWFLALALAEPGCVLEVVQARIQLQELLQKSTCPEMVHVWEKLPALFYCMQGFISETIEDLSQALGSEHILTARFLYATLAPDHVYDAATLSVHDLHYQVLGWALREQANRAAEVVLAYGEITAQEGVPYALESDNQEGLHLLKCYGAIVGN